MGEIITDFKPVEEVTDNILTDFKPTEEVTDSEERPLGGGGAGGSFDDYKTMPMGEVIKGGVETFPESAKQVGKDVASIVAHPIETAKGIGNLGLGIVEKLIPGRQGKEQYIEALDTHIRDRYGSIEGIKEALATDLAGTAFEIFSLLIPAGTASKLGITKKIGKAAGTVVGTPAKQILGVTTGVGSGPIRKAMQGGKAFRDTMTRKVLMEEVVENSKSGLRTIANERRVGYRQQLAEIRKADVDIDITPIRKKLDNLMGENEFNIRRVVDKDVLYHGANKAGAEAIERQGYLGGYNERVFLTPSKQLAEGYAKSQGAGGKVFPIKKSDIPAELLGDGPLSIPQKQLMDLRIPIHKPKLDFSRSTLNKKSHGAIKQVIDKIDDWGSQPGDLTAGGLDILKKNLDDFYSKSSNSRALVTSLKNTIKKTIVKEVPEYAKMTAQYEKYLTIEKNISQAVSLGDKAAVTTSIRSLMSAMKQDVVFRKDMIRKLQDASGIDIEAQISGAIMAELIPQGYIGRSVAAGGAMGLWLTAADPKLWLALTMTSPRVMGEFLSLIAGPTSRFTGRTARKAERITPEVIRGGYISGKTNRLAEQGEPK